MQVAAPRPPDSKKPAQPPTDYDGDIKKGDAWLSSTSGKKTSPMTRKSQSHYHTYKEETQWSGETGRSRNSPTGKQQSQVDKTPHQSSRTSLTSSTSSKPASATPTLREQCRGSWQELVWEKKLPNSTSTTSDSIRPRVDTMMSSSLNFSATDSHHGCKPESASSTPLSQCSSNGKKKKSSSTDRRGWTKQLNKTFRINKDTDNPLAQTPR